MTGYSPDPSRTRLTLTRVAEASCQPGAIAGCCSLRLLLCDSARAPATITAANDEAAVPASIAATGYSAAMRKPSVPGNLIE